MGTRGRMIGYANFVCSRCGHDVPAMWRERTKMVEGMSLYRGSCHDHMMIGWPTVPALG